MRLFHISEEPDIEVFIPRYPKRNDLDKNVAIVWAINEECLPNFLTPRDCPRVAFHATPASSPADIELFFSSPETPYVVAVESKWLSEMTETPLYIYEFLPEGFRLQDKAAGYYVSEKAPGIIGKTKVESPIRELFKRKIEVRLLPNLWPLADRVKTSTLAWSLCRMAFAESRDERQTDR